MNNPLICIIILNWNGIENTRKCLNSLLRITNKNYKIFVIDNGSKHDEASILKNEFGNRIQLFSLKKNTGFTGGCNYGITQAKKYNPDYYLLLNNDTEVDKNFLHHLISTASSDKKIGVVSPIIYDLHKKHKIIFSGGYINWLFGKTFHKTDAIPSVRVSQFITGCCLLIKKEVIQKLGALDVQFFAYFEDAAYSRTVTKAGYLCVCDPKAIIFHKESGSLNKKGQFKTYLISRNRILFVNNYAPHLIKYYFFIFNFIKLILATLIFLVTKQKYRIYPYMKGYLDGTFGKGGEPNL